MGVLDMPKTLEEPNNRVSERPSLEDYFILTGFHDLLPLANQLAKDNGYDQSEMIEAVSKVNDKFYQYPPTKSRTAWFRMVFVEKLKEARADILAFKAQKAYL